MKKIDTSRDLLRSIETRTIKRKALEAYVHTLLDRLQGLTLARKGELQKFFDENETQVRREVVDACGWAFAAAAPFLSQEDVAKTEKLLLRALNAEEYFNNPLESLSVVIDTNPENILFLEDAVSFIDVMPPKDAWRVHDRYFLVCRTSADVSALGDSAHAEVLHDAYGTRHKLPPEIVRMVYEIDAALIQVPYRKMIGRDDLAAKYADFVRMRCDDLEAMLSQSQY
jgi:hypothetical protein